MVSARRVTRQAAVGATLESCRQQWWVTPLRGPTHPTVYLVTIGVRLERAFLADADVLGLLLGQLGDHAAEALDHLQRHFFIELLRQHFHAQAFGLLRGGQLGELLAEQEDLCQHLVGEGTVHDPARVAGGVAQVDQATFGQEDQVVVVVRVEAAGAAAVDLVHLRLDLFPGPVLAHEGGVDLVVEVADVAHHGALLQGLEHVRIADVDVAGGGHDQVDPAQQGGVDGGGSAVIDPVLEWRNQFEAIHARLHGADRIDFADLDDHAFLAQRLRRTLAHVAVADHQRLLAGQQVVGATLDRIVEAVTAAVLVVVLALGHRVVDVDRRDFQGAGLEHVEQAVHAGGGFFGDAVDPVEHGRVLLVQNRGQVAAVIEDHVGVPRLAVLEDGLLDAPLVFGFGFALPGEYRDAGSGDGGGGLILGGEDVAARPAYFGAQGDQGFDQHGGLDGHVDAADDLRALERLLCGILAAHAHQRGHFRFGDDDFAAAPGGQGNVGDFEIGKTGRRQYSAHK